MFNDCFTEVLHGIKGHQIIDSFSVIKVFDSNWSKMQSKQPNVIWQESIFTGSYLHLKLSVLFVDALYQNVFSGLHFLIE